MFPNATKLICVTRPAFFALALALACVARAEAKDPTGLEVMQQVTTRHRSKDERAKAELEVKIGDAAPKSRRALLLSLSGEDGDDRMLIRFVAPADVRGISLLTRERGDDEDQYLYVPALRKVKRIASSGKTNRFAGTDFTYEDLRGEELGRNDYALKGSKTFDKHDCWIVEAKPKAAFAERTAYQKRVLLVRKDEFLILQITYLDKKGRKAKVRTNRGFRKVAGTWRFHAAIMKDFARGSRTLLKIVERKLDQGLPERLFTPKALSTS